MKKNIRSASRLGSFISGVLKHGMREKISTTLLCLAALTTPFAQDAKSYYDQGLQKIREGKFEEAIKLFDKTIALKPTHYMAWLDRGRTNLSLERFKEALADFNQVIKLDPRYFQGWLLRGSAKYNLADYEGALTDNTQAIALKPDDTWAYYYRGFANEALNKMDAACDDYNKALRLGLSIAQKKVDNCNGISKSTKESPLRLQNDEVYYTQGYEKELSGKFEEAIKLFDSAIALKEDYFMAWVNRAYCNGMLNRYKDAIADYSQVIALSPDYQDGWFYRGLAKYELSDYAGALADYTHAITLDSKDAEAFYNRAFAYESLQQTDNACADYSRALELGLKIAQNAVDKCNRTTSMTKQTDFVILDTEGERARLIAVNPLTLVIHDQTLLGILFFLVTPADSYDLSGTFNTQLKSDPTASIEIKLKNGVIVNMEQSPNSQDTLLGKPVLFMAILNQEAKEMLSENDIDVISFKKGNTVYKYSIKDAYTGKIKEMLSLLASDNSIK